MNSGKLRLLIRRYGDLGILLVACYLGMRFLWKQRRAPLLASLALTLLALLLICSPHCSSKRQTLLPLRVSASVPVDVPSLAFEQAVLQAADKQDEVRLTALLTDPANFHVTDTHGHGVLSLAVGLPAGFDTWGDTPLRGSALASRTRCVRLLLQRGANPNVKGIRHFGKATVLHQAARYGYTDMVSLLLDSGAALDAPDSEGGTAVMEAAMGDGSAFRLLVERGANVNVTVNAMGRTLLMDKAGWGDEEEIKQLIQAGAHIDARDAEGDTALMYAVQHDLVENVRMLLTWHADVNVRDAEGKTALAEAKEGLAGRMVTSFNHELFEVERAEEWHKLVHLLKQAGAKE